MSSRFATGRILSSGNENASPSPKAGVFGLPGFVRAGSQGFYAGARLRRIRTTHRTIG